MGIQRFLNLKVLLPLAVIMALTVIVACGGSEEATKAPAAAPTQDTSASGPAPTDAPEATAKPAAPADTPCSRRHDPSRPTLRPRCCDGQVVSRPTPDSCHHRPRTEGPCICRPTPTAGTGTPKVHHRFPASRRSANSTTRSCSTTRLTPAR